MRTGWAVLQRLLLSEGWKIKDRGTEDVFQGEEGRDLAKNEGPSSCTGNKNKAQVPAFREKKC